MRGGGGPVFKRGRGLTWGGGRAAARRLRLGLLLSPAAARAGGGGGWAGLARLGPWPSRAQG